MTEPYSILIPTVSYPSEIIGQYWLLYLSITIAQVPPLRIEDPTLSDTVNNEIAFSLAASNAF